MSKLLCSCILQVVPRPDLGVQIALTEFVNNLTELASLAIRWRAWCGGLCPSVRRVIPVNTACGVFCRIFFDLGDSLSAIQLPSYRFDVFFVEVKFATVPDFAGTSVETFQASHGRFATSKAFRDSSSTFQFSGVI